MWRTWQPVVYSSQLDHHGKVFFSYWRFVLYFPFRGKYIINFIGAGSQDTIFNWLFCSNFRKVYCWMLRICIILGQSPLNNNLWIDFHQLIYNWNYELHRLMQCCTTFHFHTRNTITKFLYFTLLCVSQSFRKCVVGEMNLKLPPQKSTNGLHLFSWYTAVFQNC